MPKRSRLTRTEVIECKQLKAAAGGSGASGGGTFYAAGQKVICRIVAEEPGGYAVIIPKDNLVGSLPTDAKLKVGEEILEFLPEVVF